MNSLFSKGSLERVFVACAALIVATSLIVFYVTYVVLGPQAIHQKMMEGQPPQFVAHFDWADWQQPSEMIRQDHQSEFQSNFEVRAGVLQMLCFEVHVIQARGFGVTKFLDGQRDEVRIIPKTRTIAGLAGGFVLIWATMLLWVVKSVQTRRRMIKAGTAEPV